MPDSDRVLARREGPLLLAMSTSSRVHRILVWEVLACPSFASCSARPTVNRLSSTWVVATGGSIPPGRTSGTEARDLRVLPEADASSTHADRPQQDSRSYLPPVLAGPSEARGPLARASVGRLLFVVQSRYQNCWWCRRHVKNTRLVYAPEVMAITHVRCLWAPQWMSKVYKRPKVGEGLKGQIANSWTTMQEIYGRGLDCSV